MKITDNFGVKNQYVLSEPGNGANGNFLKKEIFQSYDSNIVERITWDDGRVDVRLDALKWDYSATTRKYRNRFLNETTQDIQHKINEGIYKLTNLN